MFIIICYLLCCLFQDVIPNSPWQVPSCFYLTDALLELDRLFGHYLLLENNGKTKELVAGEEAKRLKRLMSSLRHLYRNCYLASYFIYCMSLVWIQCAV